MILAVLSAAALASCAGDKGDKGESMKTEESSGTSSQTAATEAPEDDAPESFNVLAIGNSFTIDTFEYLYGIAESYGAENIYLANAAIGGAGLVNHIECLRVDLAKYDYYLFNGRTESTSGHTLKECLGTRKWDVIAMIGTSGVVGLDNQYPLLSELISYVKENSANPDARLVWLFSWAYQSDSTHPSFPLYDRDQMKMHTMGVKMTEKYAATNPDISVVVPLATTFQNIRTGFIGDHLTRDGFHADLTVGRYALALTFYCSVTGADPWKCSFRLETGVTEEGKTFDLIAESVENAIKEPYKVTQSAYTQE